MPEMWIQVVNLPTVISTFAGCGGSSLGYKLAGFRELLAVEWDDNAVATFRLNFPQVPVYHNDIAKLTGTECMRLAGIKVGELDVLDGSPPCQGFSTAGKRRFDDPRNSLFCEYARLLKEQQPRVFIMENVTGMIKGYMKQAYLTIIAKLRACGYLVRGEVLNAMYFNVPQNRERVIIIGVRNDIGIEPSCPKPQTQPITVRQAWTGLPKQEVPPLSKFLKNVVPRMKPGQCADDISGKGGFQTVRILWNKPCPVITKLIGGIGFGMLIHPEEHRVLSVDEMKLATSFPMTFQFCGRYQDQRARIGNSVPPNLMRAIAEHVRNKILAKIRL